jgi:hypothetical protein
MSSPDPTTEPERTPGETLNRDEEMKPDRPPRSAYEPDGAEGSERTPKTWTDPASGAPLRERRAPDRSDGDERDG